MREAEIVSHAVVEAVSCWEGGLELVLMCLCLSVCVTYLESSVCPDNALHTGNALTGSCRTGDVTG